MLGADVAHDQVPYFFSDLSDWASLEYVGPAEGWDDEELDGSPEDGAFAVTYRQGGDVKAVLSVGGAADLDRARELIRGA
jgi:3-phenylpropionate/trans-cinnamate dioxygenase ferredoxin reductase subunit